MCIYKYICINMCIYIYIYMCIYLKICVYMCKYMYIYSNFPPLCALANPWVFPHCADPCDKTYMFYYLNGPHKQYIILDIIFNYIPYFGLPGTCHNKSPENHPSWRRRRKGDFYYLYYDMFPKSTIKYS